MKLIRAICLLGIIVTCCNEEPNGSDPKSENQNQKSDSAITQPVKKTTHPVENIVSRFLNDVNSLPNNNSVNPISDFVEIAENMADKKLVFDAENINEVLINASKYSSCVVVTDNHTIVKIIDIGDCQKSGSWKACVPKASGYIKKNGKLDFKNDYMNFIIGVPDNQKRVAYFFNSSYNQNTEVVNSPEINKDNSKKDIVKFQGKEPCDTTVLGDSIFYDYKSYTVTTSPTASVGDFINVYNKENQSSFTIGKDDWAIYFYAIMNHYMIIDEGTGTVRTFSIYDLNNQNKVFENVYYENLEIIGSKIHFVDRVEITDDIDKPDCPKELLEIGYGIGYSEKLIYDMQTHKLERTGIIECKYFE